MITENKPRILLTNDDGFWAEGLQALYHKLETQTDVFIVAPERECSGLSHGLTMTRPMRAKAQKINGKLIGYSLDGMPADCVKFALAHVMKDNPPDMVVSGINPGQNTGINVLYSGTVAAAFEGAVYGIRSMAVSLARTGGKPDYSVAVEITQKLIRIYPSLNLPVSTILNVNIPELPLDQIAGWGVPKHGRFRVLDYFTKAQEKEDSYWLHGNWPDDFGEPDSDEATLQEFRVIITPLSYDLTDYNSLKALQQRAIEEDLLDGLLE